MPTMAALVQIAPEKADVSANLQRIAEAVRRSSSEGADLVVFPEAVLTGYFLEGGVIEVALPADEVARRLAQAVGDIGRPVDVILGYYEEKGGLIYNSASHFCLDSGAANIAHTHRKFFLPTYGVFDEERFVARGKEIQAYDTRFGRMAMLICEDIWHSVTPMVAALKGAETIVSIAASPARDFTAAKPQSLESYHRIVQRMAEEHGVWALHSMLVGFEGGKGFAGGSIAVDPFGKVVGEGPVGVEHFLHVEVDHEAVAVARNISPMLADLASVLEDVIRELREVDEEACPPR
ncbi:MAG: nitrilase-related carbon-nitrogen hydrolase [Armatimonadota bacterium]